MKEITKTILIGLGCVVGLFVLIFVSQEAYRFFGPRGEDIRREVFKSTHSYNQAKVQELAKYRLEYLREKNADSKEAIASTIRHLFADYDSQNLQPELRNFLKHEIFKY